MTLSEPQTPSTLLQLQRTLEQAVLDTPREVWITAELSDVRESGPHCYMELIDKDPQTGATTAKARATIWANVWTGIKFRFLRETGRPFASGLSVMVRVNALYHPVYGMSLNITAVNPSFTMGERERRRREILERLRQEGMADENRSKELPRPCLRIAVISSPGAAGYGDFMNQLLGNNPRNIRFQPVLFPAVMQGNQVAASVIARLDEIAARMEEFDCVCIIRGGGASTDLDGFDDYLLAANVAQFPLPVIVGIGHERDTTVLDYICAERVKTPTAAAELLASRAAAELDLLRNTGGELLQLVSDTLNGYRQQLAYISGQLPTVPLRATEQAARRLENAALNLSRIAQTRLMPLGAWLDRAEESLKNLTRNRLSLAAQQVDASAKLLAALSPAAILSRGFSITRVNGVALTSSAQVSPGDVITTTLAEGTLTATVFTKE